MGGRPRFRTWLDRRRRWKRNEKAPPAPHGWRVAPPDFVGVGVEKAGTSWWYEQIVGHPAVVRPQFAHKELRYFNRFGRRPFTVADVVQYHRLFPRPPGAICGEWTPSYVADFWVPPLLAHAAPETRLLLMLRDPVERYVSGLAQLRARGRPAGLAERRRAFERGCYALQLERLWQWFSPEQTLVLQFEDCRRNPVDNLRRTQAFLGLDVTAPPEDLRAPVHVTRVAKPVLERTERADLALAYASEMRRLGTLCPDLDLDLWMSAGELKPAEAIDHLVGDQPDVTYPQRETSTPVRPPSRALEGP